MTAVADPLGGSWYVERLTRELEDKAWALIEEVEAHGGMTKAVAEGLPKHRIEEAAAERAAKVDTGETVIVGVNRYRLAQEEEHAFLEVDNAKVRAGQIARLEKMRESRDEAKVARGAGCAGERARGRCEPARALGRGGAGALLAGRDFGRAGAGVRALPTTPEPVRGIYGRRNDGRWRAAVSTQAVAKRLGRKPRILVAKMGQDGHDRGANLVSSAFGDLGFEVIAGTLVPDPARDGGNGGREGRRRGRRIVPGRGPQDIDPRADRRAEDAGRADIKVVAGGVIPPQDYAMLRAAGVQAIFGPGTNLADAADEVLRLLGHNRPPLDEAAE